MPEAKVQGTVLATERTAVAVVAVKSSGSDAKDLTTAVSVVATALGCVQGADVLATTDQSTAARRVAWAMTRDQRAWMTVASRGQPTLSPESVQALRAIMGEGAVTWWSVSVTWRGQTRDVSPMIGAGVLLYSWSGPQPANPTDPRTIQEARAYAEGMASGVELASSWAGAIPSLEAAQSVAGASGALLAALPEVAKSVSNAVESLAGFAQAAPWLLLGGLVIWAGQRIMKGRALPWPK